MADDADDAVDATTRTAHKTAAMGRRKSGEAGPEKG